jgi:trafficking protein particle complex subunit 13
MQTPSIPAGFGLELTGPEGKAEGEEGTVSPGPGGSLQKILRYELKEEGNHVLAVTVTYTETSLAGGTMAATDKVRTFRKLYQFVAQQLLSVRTKAGDAGTGRFLLEAQLENMGEAAVSVEVRLRHLSDSPQLGF